MPTAIGFVGVGRMGSRFARRFAAHGHDVHAHDPSPAALETLREDPVTAHDALADLLAAVDVVVLSLPRPDVVTAVTRDIAEHAGSRSLTVIDTSTCGIDTCRAAAEALTAAGVAFLDAPVSGGISGAADGSLAVMVGGDADLFAAHEATLRTIGKKLFHVGPEPGQGQVMKVVNNILSLGALAATAEAATVAARAGIPLETTIAILNAGSGRNSATEDKFPRSVLTGTYDFGWPVTGALKDSGLYQRTADALGVPTVVGAAVVAAWQQATDEGWGDEDFTAIARLYARHAEQAGGAA